MEYLRVRYLYHRFLASIDRMKVGWWMVVPKNLDDDAVKDAKRWHIKMLTQYPNAVALNLVVHGVGRKVEAVGPGDYAILYGHFGKDRRVTQRGKDTRCWVKDHLPHLDMAGSAVDEAHCELIVRPGRNMRDNKGHVRCHDLAVL